jgi:hypothetical protein
MSKARDIADLGAVTSRLDTVGASDGALSNRNLIINGAMQVAQRGTSTTGITTSGYYACDRWNVATGSLGTWTASQDSDAPDGLKNSFKLVPTIADASPAAGDYFQIEQKLEAQDTEHFKYGTSDAKAFTVSFWVKSNKTGTYNLRAYRVVDSTRMASKQYTINSAGTWEYKTITFDGDTSVAMTGGNTLGILLSWWLAAGSTFTSGSNQNWGSYLAANEAPSQVNLADSTSNYWQITGVQLEVGDTATPFEHRSYGDELARCERYYQKWSGGGTTPYFISGRNHNSSTSIMTLTYRNEMRGRPSVSISSASDLKVYDGYDRTLTGITLNGNGPTSCGMNVNGLSSGVGNNYVAQLYFISPNGYFALDAEL